MQEQSSLGNRFIVGKQPYNQTQIGKVTSTANYEAYGRIEVAFLDYSKPAPVWVVGDLDRAPVAGDLVLVGFIQNRSDAPYLAGYVRNECYTANFVKIEKDKITIQMPTVAADINGHLLDTSMKGSRVSIELTASGVAINGSISCTGDITCSGNINAANI